MTMRFIYFSLSEPENKTHCLSINLFASITKRYHIYFISSFYFVITLVLFVFLSSLLISLNVSLSPCLCLSICMSVSLSLCFSVSLSVSFSLSLLPSPLVCLLSLFHSLAVSLLPYNFFIHMVYYSPLSSSSIPFIMPLILF